MNSFVLKKYVLIIAFCLGAVVSCSSEKETGDNAGSQINIDYVAENYIILAFRLNKFDHNYIDNYFGPDSLKAIGEKDSTGLKEIIARGNQLLAILDTIMGSNADLKVRKKFISAMLGALVAKAQILDGKKYNFDEECKALYGVNVPILQENYYQKILVKIDSILPPSKKNLNERYEEFAANFVVPMEKIDTVFRLAIEEGRRRTKEYIELVTGEKFIIEYVTGKPWAAYNWYKGAGNSIIQVNTDVPMTIDKIIELAFHEGYPGHHVYHQLLEKQMVWENKWLEYSIYPLFSPLALISEGTANYGVELIMTMDERVKFEKEVLLPAAGIDTNNYSRFKDLVRLKNKLNYAANDAARFLIEGRKTKDEAAAWLAKHQIRTQSEAMRFMDFIETYGAYVINYNYGKDLVKNYIESHGGKNDRHLQKSLFKKLLTTSVIPSDLKD